jgi:hypothetical protein
MYAKIAEGLAAWLTYEHRCGRANLFSEASLAHPLGDLLQYRFSGRVQAELEHPILASRHTGVGKKPRVDFAVDGTGGIYDLVVEAKWASQSATLLEDMLSDIVRLSLLLGGHTRDALLLLAGERRAISRLFGQPRFGASPELADKNEMYLYGANKPLFPVGERPNSSLRFAPVPPFRRSLYVRALKPFRGLELSRLVYLRQSGPFPRVATSRNYEIFVWRVLNYGGATFVPDEEYEELGRNPA